MFIFQTCGIFSGTYSRTSVYTLVVTEEFSENKEIQGILFKNTFITHDISYNRKFSPEGKVRSLDRVTAEIGLSAAATFSYFQVLHGQISIAISMLVLVIACF